MKQSTTDQTAESDSALTNRAVSPVIGVILMVAITVILAAVIGAFVLEIGDQQETAPNASFDTEESVKTIVMGETYLSGTGDFPPHEMTKNQSVVEITHAGGDTMAYSNFDVVINGNSSVWGLKGEINTDYTCRQPVEPTPDFLETLGTNEEASFTSGESMRPYMFGGEPRNDYDPKIGEKLHSDDWPTWGEKGPWDATWKYSTETNGQGSFALRIQERTVSGKCDQGTGDTGGDKINYIIEGDDVSMVWTADSGGKTQSLFSYTVQQGDLISPP